MALSFDLIIFDCDGVLIDSEVISTHTLLDTLGGHGLDVDIGYVRRTYLGRTISVVKSDYLRLMGRDLAETFEADFLARLSEAYKRDLVSDGRRARAALGDDAALLHGDQQQRRSGNVVARGHRTAPVLRGEGFFALRW